MSRFVADSLPALRDVIAETGLSAKKSLGQNFLLDLNLTRKIVRVAGSVDGMNVIEIGPGPGGLTRAILETTAAHITAVERDDRAIEALQPLVAAAAGRLTLLAEDALKIDPADVAEEPRAIIANLPYNIATPLILKWLAVMERYHLISVMVQKEVGDRLTAEVGTKSFGRLSVIAQWSADVDHLMTVPARAFSPPPKVDGAIIRFLPKPGRDISLTPWLERATGAGFGQRRKTLRRSLGSLGGPDLVERLCRASGVDPGSRAETVTVEQWVKIAETLRNQ